jgi:hypothetical protein
MHESPLQETAEKGDATMRLSMTVFIACIVASVIPLAGCTPEKAEALLTAVKAFEAQSSQALTAYEGLFKDYRAIKKDSKEQLFNQAYEAAKKDQRMTPNQFLANIGQLDEEQSSNKIESEFQELRAAYSLLSSAYASLPQGSLFAAQYVSCGQTVVAKLTQQLINFAGDIKKSPLYPLSIRQEIAEFKRLARQGDAQKEETRQKFDTIYSAIAAYEEKHRNALTLTLAAVEQGRKLYLLLGQYDEVSIADILGAIQYGFSFVGTLNGIDVSRASGRLRSIKEEMDKLPEWKRVESLPLGTIAECKANPTK